MTIRMKERRIRSLFVKGKAMAVSHADSMRLDRFHQLSGRQMTLYFTGHALDQIVVERNATSLYFLSDETGPSGVNRASGDRITIDFSLGGADRIAVVGGVQGTHTPERLVAGHIVDQNLDGFRWIEQRPVRTGLTIVER
jgi:hypothetical protein